MFNKIAQRLGPSVLGQSAKRILPSATPKIPSMRCQGYHRGGVTLLERSMTTTLPTASPSMSIGNLTSVFSRSMVINNSLCINALPSKLPSSTTACTAVGSILSQQSRGFASKKHKRIIRMSKGFRGRSKNCFRIAIRRLEKSWQYAYRDRKVKKREFRKLWIQRLNAGVRQHGISYSKFINLQTKSGVVLDRKILSNLAMYEPFSFKAVVDVVKMAAADGAGK